MLRGSWWKALFGDSRSPTRYEVRIPMGVGARLVASLMGAPAGSSERVTFALAGTSKAHDRTVLLPFQLRPVPDDLYRRSAGHGATWSHQFTTQVLNEAAEAACGVVLVHSHGGRGPPRLSADDVQTFERLRRVFAEHLPDQPFASLVISADHHVSGLMSVGRDGTATVASAQWLGPAIKVRPSRAGTAVPPERYSRHDAVWGPDGQERLANSSVGVLGAGGGGSHIVQQLAHAGVGRIVVVDNDVVDESNRSRLVGSERRDRGVPKVTIMQRLARRANEHVELVAVRDRFPMPRAADALVGCDVIVSCVDTLHARKDVQEFAWRHAIPVVDIGLTIRPRTSGAPLRIGGHVAVAIPGGPCLWCMGLLSDEKLAAESGGRGAAYVEGGGEAQVVSLNGVLASQAVNDVLDLLTGFSGHDHPPDRLVFNGIERSIQGVTSMQNPACATCATALGRGTPTWTKAA